MRNEELWYRLSAINFLIGDRWSPVSCLPNLRYPPYLASSSTAAKSLRSVLASKLGAAMSFLTPHSSLKPLLTPHLTSFLT